MNVQRRHVRQLEELIGETRELPQRLVSVLGNQVQELSGDALARLHDCAEELADEAVMILQEVLQHAKRNAQLTVCREVELIRIRNALARLRNWN